MKKYFIFIFIVLLSNSAFCQSFFDTDFYEINFISNNVDNDKQKKIKEIKFKSIKKIFNNILIKDDYDTFNRNLNEDLINSFIKNIIFEDEKIINNNYYSKIKINFDVKKIIQYLRNNKLPYVEYYPNNFLLIIFENKKLTKNLFSKKNSYYKYLINNNLYLDFFNLPNFDVNDKYLLNFSDIEDLNLNKINKFMNKYSNSNAVIVTSNQTDNKIKYTSYIYSRNNLTYLGDFYQDTYDYELFFKKLKNDVLSQWKIENSMQNITLNNFLCEINYYNLLELKQIRLNISNVSLIDELKLKKISYQSNIYEISYYGDKRYLPKLFTMNNLEIQLNDKCKILLK